MFTLNFYDNYNYPNNPYNTTVSNTLTQPTGLLTASKTAVLLPDGTFGPMLWTVHFYDGKGRLAQTYQQHYLNGGTNTSDYDETVFAYNFNDQITHTIRHHYTQANTTTPALTVGTAYTYDHMGRKTQTLEQLNGGTNVLLSQEDYNEIGQLMTKHLGNDAQQISYAYNERGWLKAEVTSGNLFNLDLRYNNPDGSTQPQWNGNISQMGYLTTKAATPGTRTFAYTYDNLNRLTKAAFSGGLPSDSLDENISYDEMGNITKLIRANAGTLNYTSYTGNQLNTVTGYSPRNYAYDANGNATSDGNTQQIDYNMLNLPQDTKRNNAIVATYTYDATGQKLRNTGSDGTWDYIGGVVYKNGTVYFIQTEEGRMPTITVIITTNTTCKTT